MKKVVVIGNGFIASHLPYEKSNWRLTPNEEDILDFLSVNKPDVVINCIGRCGNPNVDQCEIIKAETALANITLPIMLASECERKNVHFIHLGSGCINYGPSPNSKQFYNGQFTTAVDTGWKESDFSHPLSYYSKTKYAADLALGQMENVSILRLRMPISVSNSQRNLLNKITKYKEVVKSPNSMTFVNDLVNAIDFVINKTKIGIYNIASPKPLYHSDLLEEYRKYYPEHSYVNISEKKLDRMVLAPRSNCILDVSKIQNEGFEFKNTEQQIRETIEQFVMNKEDKNAIK